MFSLAADPDLAGVLREEAEAVTKLEGWTKNALSKMYKLDSFLRENQRCTGDDGRKSISFHRQIVALSRPSSHISFAYTGLFNN